MDYSGRRLISWYNKHYYKMAFVLLSANSTRRCAGNHTPNSQIRRFASVTVCRALRVLTTFSAVSICSVVIVLPVIS
ncbi:hypothetical protein L596_004114 [Steinernema carpocapsae]|uniref:Uncharacterized protein n=1 Tax=Steinernema carpocapsae TaxID=34508 RepID=A0A4V6I874_STECR|nr:hypothetical protein L596_004114 [Steinernema carpocapsae]